MTGDSRRHFRTASFFVVLAIFGVGALAQRAVALAQKPVAMIRGHRVQVFLPVRTNEALEDVILQFVEGTEIALGFERVLDPGLPAGMSLKPLRMKRMDVTGRPFGEVLTELLRAPSFQPVASSVPYQFAWKEDRSIIHISAMGARQTWLDTVLPSFAVKDQPLNVAFSLLRQAFDPKYQVTKHPPDVTSFASTDNPTADLERLHRVRNDLKKPITVSLSNVTARQALDAMVLAHGRSAWVVRFSSFDGSYEGSEIAFKTFSGVRVNVQTINVRPRRQ